VELATFSGVWIARETVAMETSAIRATSSMVADEGFDNVGLGYMRDRTLHRLADPSNRINEMC